jgi:hypothetical protein
MRKRAPLLVGPLVVLCGGLSGCGHRADPLPPLRKTPPAPTEFRLAQRGEQLELQATAPPVSVDGIAYQALAVEFLHGGEKIDLEKKGTRVQVTAAPGAAAVVTLALPKPGTVVRAAARALARGERGQRTLTALIVAHAPLEPPTRLEASLSGNGIELRWRGQRPDPIEPPAPPALPFTAKEAAKSPTTASATAGSASASSASVPAPPAAAAQTAATTTASPAAKDSPAAAKEAAPAPSRGRQRCP